MGFKKPTFWDQKVHSFETYKSTVPGIRICDFSLFAGEVIT